MSMLCSVIGRKKYINEINKRTRDVHERDPSLPASSTINHPPHFHNREAGLHGLP